MKEQTKSIDESGPGAVIAELEFMGAAHGPSVLGGAMIEPKLPPLVGD